MIQFPPDYSASYLQNNLRKGDVLFWKDFEFPDGSEKTSRFVILTECKKKEVLSVRATTKVKHYDNNPSFNIEYLDLKAGQEEVFEKRTILDFTNGIHELSIEKMKDFWGTRKKHKGGCLSSDTIEKINNLVESSKTLPSNQIDWILNSKERT